MCFPFHNTRVWSEKIPLSRGISVVCQPHRCALTGLAANMLDVFHKGVFFIIYSAAKKFVSAADGTWRHCGGCVECVRQPGQTAAALAAVNIKPKQPLWRLAPATCERVSAVVNKHCLRLHAELHPAMLKIWFSRPIGLLWSEIYNRAQHITGDFTVKADNYHSEYNLVVTF